MASRKQGVAVVRISRQSLAQPHSTEYHENVEPDPSTIQLKPPELTQLHKKSPNKKEHINVSRTKTDVFAVDHPRASDAKSEDRNRQSPNFSRPSLAIQQQPIQTNTWITRSSNNFTRPQLNWKATGKWTHGLYGILEDPNMCCYACACWCCFRHEISTMMGEHWCVWFLNCAPLIELRTKFRQHYEIEGSIAEDFCAAIFCPLCAALQLANEGRDRGHRIFS